MDHWLENNNRYLEASLEWLRLRLEQLVSESGATSEFSKERLNEAAAKREVAAQVDPAPALLILANRLGLSDFERDVLLLCAALEFDPALAVTYGHAQLSQTRNYPTFALALSVFDDASWDALAAHRPLRYLRLIEINQPGSTPLTAAALRADERVVNFLKGLNVLDDRLSIVFHPLNVNGESLLSQSQHDVVRSVVQCLHDCTARSLPLVVEIVGADSSTRAAIAQHASRALGRYPHQIRVDALPSQLGECETLARLWQRESLLLPVALYIEVDNRDDCPPESIKALERFLSRDMGFVFVGVRDVPLRMPVTTFAVEVNKPTPAEQCDAWTEVFRSDLELTNGTPPAMLAGQFDFSLTEIHEAGTLARKLATKTNPVWEACRSLTRPRLDALAERLEPKATWNDLVLPPDQMALMRQIAGQVRERHKVYQQWGFARVMNRGFGISALFSGESGTGKTMAAEVIANDLRLDLYRIDLSAVVSKYIGETEKNLRKLFDGAESGGAILFFDEADALFGKRSEVKDSHDRYANIEINYLLQRMEAFRGLAILATNMKSALDAAFMRRLRFIVNLTFPGQKERKQIWEKVLPVQTPQHELNYDRLARLNLSGGNIHSIALNAAFMAAQNGQTVTMPLLISAARTELRKLEKSFSEAELR